MTAGLAEVLERAKKLVIPNAAAREETARVSESVMRRVKQASKRYSEVRGVVLGGSFAKDTWLAGDVDIDVFVKISPDVDEKRFEDVGLSVGREALAGFKPGKEYAQHPYTEATVEGFKVNVVPCYDVEKGEWRSAADRSVHHVSFVREHLDDDARLQVRLLKKFMKAVGVYGAEIQKEGFSGYATEVLIHEYETFEATLRGFSVFSPDSEAYFSLFDPIDDDRDLGKAISKETVAKMVLASRAFLESPSMAFFRRVRGRARPRLMDRLVAIMFDHAELSEDTLWGELKRSTRQVAKHVRDEGFVIARAEAASDNRRSSAIILLPVVDSLPDLEERQGPGVEMREGAESFAGKNRRSAELIWVGEDGRLRLLGKRRYTSLFRLLDEMLGPRLDKVGVSTEIADALKKNGRILRGDRLRKSAAKSGWLAEGLARITEDAVGT